MAERYWLAVLMDELVHLHVHLVLVLLRLEVVRFVGLRPRHRVVGRVSIVKLVALELVLVMSAVKALLVLIISVLSLLTSLPTLWVSFFLMADDLLSKLLSSSLTLGLVLLGARLELVSWLLASGQILFGHNNIRIEFLFNQSHHVL